MGLLDRWMRRNDMGPPPEIIAEFSIVVSSAHVGDLELTDEVGRPLKGDFAGEMRAVIGADARRACGKMRKPKLDIAADYLVTGNVSTEHDVRWAFEPVVKPAKPPKDLSGVWYSCMFLVADKLEADQR